MARVSTSCPLIRPDCPSISTPLDARNPVQVAGTVPAQRRTHPAIVPVVPKYIPPVFGKVKPWGETPGPNPKPEKYKPTKAGLKYFRAVADQLKGVDDISEKEQLLRMSYRTKMSRLLGLYIKESPARLMSGTPRWFSRLPSGPRKEEWESLRRWCRVARLGLIIFLVKQSLKLGRLGGVKLALIHARSRIFHKRRWAELRRSRPLGYLSGTGAALNPAKRVAWNNHWRHVRASALPLVSGSENWTVAYPLLHDCTRDFPSEHESETKHFVQFSDVSDSFYETRREFYARRLQSWARKRASRNLEKVEIYKRQDVGIEFLILCAFAGILGVVLVVPERGKAMIVYLSLVLAFTGSLVFWGWLRFGDLKHLVFAGISARFEYGEFGSTWEYSVMKGRTSNFFGSGYNSTEERMIRKDFEAAMQAEMTATVIGTTSIKSAKNIVLQKFKPELDRYAARGDWGRVRAFHKFNHFTAIYFCQSEENKTYQERDRTSDLTPSRLMDQDFSRRGAPMGAGHSWSLTALGLAPPRRF